MDYQFVSGRLEFAPGVTTQTVKVPVINDTLDELDKNFHFILSNPLRAALGQSQAVGAILDNDPAPVINIEDASVTEDTINGNNATLLFTATLSAPSAKAISVNYAFSGGTATANADYYVPPFTTLTFPAGTTTLKFGVTVVDDDDHEPAETFFLDLINPVNVTLARARIQATIFDDDPQPFLSLDGSSAFAHEGNSGTTAFPIFVQMSNASYQTVTVNYATTNGSAVAGSDYVAASGSLTFNPGETRKSFNVHINGDTIDETDKTFAVNLGGATNATINISQASALILDDDGPNISINDVSVNEGNTGAQNATFTLSLSASSPQPVSSIIFATSDGTATGGTDYARSFGRLVSVPAGQTSATFNIQIVGDLNLEPDETFNVNLSNALGATLTATLATLHIEDNDATTGTVNPSRPTAFFVRMHYLDFLSREPEANEPWSAVLNNCPNAFNLDPASHSAACGRLIVSQSFFGSLEFRLKGIFVYDFYRVAFDRRPEYAEVIPDMRSVTGQNPAEVYQKRAQFAADFAGRAEFKTRYDALSDTAYVNALLDRYGLQQITTPAPQNPEGSARVTLTRAALINGLSAATGTEKAMQLSVPAPCSLCLCGERCCLSYTEFKVALMAAGRRLNPSLF